MGLVQAVNSTYPFYGDSAGETVWFNADGPPVCEADFLDQQSHDARWPWTDHFGGLEKQQELMNEHRKNMREAWSNGRLGR